MSRTPTAAVRLARPMIAFAAVLLACGTAVAQLATQRVNVPTSAVRAADNLYPTERPFHMGFTAFPYDLSLEALNETTQFVNDNGDIFCVHNDHGVPWPEALAGDLESFPQSLRDDIARTRAAIGPDEMVYVSATAQRNSRDDTVALYWGATQSMPLPPDWVDKPIDDPDVIAAYLNWCDFLIAELRPDYFAYGIEANGGFASINDPAYLRFRRFVSQVYPQLKQRHPELPIFLTVQPTNIHAPRELLLELTADMLQFSDWIGVSVYPYLRLDADSPPFGLATSPTIDTIPPDLLTRIRELDPSKPFAITETGFHAERLLIPDIAIDLPGTEFAQAEYIVWLLVQLDLLDAEFVIWFVPRDHDRLNDFIFPDGNPDILSLIWRDTGLLDGDGNRRLAHLLWRRWLRATHR